MRLIDADRLKRVLIAFFTGAHLELPHISKVIDFLDTAPTIDAEPVRHARWVDNHCTACGMMPIGDEMWKHCDFEPPRFELFMDYCPSCGAKMEGDKR